MLAGCCLALAGCGANMASALATARQVAQPPTPQTAPAPAGVPSVWVQRGRQGGWMVRGDAASSSAGSDLTSGPSHWYSADGALLRLDAGRVLGFTEPGRQWTTVSPLPPVDWHAVSAGAPLSFARLVDEQPGYRLGQRWQRTLQASAKGGPHHSPLVQALPPGSRWFMEHSPHQPQQGRFWYAVDMTLQPARVVYGQACVTPTLCLEWVAAPGTAL